MNSQSIVPVCAYDIDQHGVARAVTEAWPDTKPHEAYRWLHFNRLDATFETWATDHLPRAAAKALLQSETRPHCHAIQGGMILNLRGVNLNDGADAEDMVSIRLWVSEGLIVSARRDKIFALDAVRADIDAGRPPRDIAAFLAALSFGLTKRIEAVSLGLAEATDEAEDRAFDEKSAPPANIPALRQSIIKLRRFVRPQAEALIALGSGTVWPLDDLAKGHLRETINRNKRTIEELDATNDRLGAIQDHEDAKAATALGRNTYVLSIIAAVFLPLGFLTGLFGINVGGMPLIDSQAGFAMVAGGCVAIGALVLLVFRFLRWL